MFVTQKYFQPKFICKKKSELYEPVFNFSSVSRVQYYNSKLTIHFSIPIHRFTQKP